jgi:hypothetical protein
MKRAFSFLLFVSIISCLPSGLLAQKIHLASYTTVEAVVNGDFSLGDTAFTTGTLSSNCQCAAGSYCIGDDTHDKCSFKPYFTSSGNFMIVDGYSSGSSHREFWGQKVIVQPNTTYYFSFRVRDQFDNTSANFDIEVNVNNALIGTTPNFRKSWKKFTYSWNSGNLSGPIDLSLHINGSAYRDFAIDDISFGYRIYHTMDDDGFKEPSLSSAISNTAAFKKTDDLENLNSISNSKLSWSVYPNPVTDLARIHIKDIQNEFSKIDLTIFDLSGKVHLTYSNITLTEIGTVKETTIDVNTLKQGLYILVLNYGDKEVSTKLFVE